MFERVLISSTSTCLLILLGISETVAVVKFKSLKCEPIDESFGYFEQCKIKALSRTVNSFTIRYNLNRTAHSAQVHFRIMKKANGWRPFLQNNFAVNACDFLKKRKKYVVANLFYTHGLKYTNANHTCPYVKGEVLSVEDLRSDVHSAIKTLPIDIGEYGLFSTFFANGIMVCNISGSMAYTQKAELG